MIKTTPITSRNMVDKRNNSEMEEQKQTRQANEVPLKSDVK